MTTWILIYIVLGSDGYPGNSPVATGSVVFHSQVSCEAAAAHFHKAFCLEDSPSATQPKPVEAK